MTELRNLADQLHARRIGNYRHFDATAYFIPSEERAVALSLPDHENNKRQRHGEIPDPLDTTKPCSRSELARLGRAMLSAVGNASDFNVLMWSLHRTLASAG
jgi:hypothetical protein